MLERGKKKYKSYDVFYYIFMSARSCTQRRRRSGCLAIGVTTFTT